MFDLDSFSDLLENYEQESSLYITLGSWLVCQKVTYPEFQKLAKWLACYKYVLPNQREIYPDLSDWIYNRSRYNLFALALIISHIMAHYSLEQQALLLKELSKKGDYQVEKPPENRAILTSACLDF